MTLYANMVLGSDHCIDRKKMVMRDQKLQPIWGIGVPDQPSVYGGVFPDSQKNAAFYGSLLAANKARLCAAFAKNQISTERRFLLMAMAMQETNTMSEADRDLTLDKAVSAKNVSIFNLSLDLVDQIKPQANGQPHTTQSASYLNPIGNLDKVVEIINLAIDKTDWAEGRLWRVPGTRPKDIGVRGVLNFIRGGRDTFIDGVKYFAVEYRSAIKTIIEEIEYDSMLMTDHRRVWVDVTHV